MAGQWTKTKSTGVRYRLHPTRKHGVNFDRYYTIRYKVNGREKSEGLGWASEGWTEKKASDTLTELKANYTRGEGPSSLAEKREIKRQQQEAKAEEERRLANRWTIERLWDEYRKQLPGGNAHRVDVGRWKLYLQKQFGHKEPRELVKLDTDRLRINLLKKRSPQTTKHVCALLRRVINYGADRGLIAPLPFKITMPHVDNEKTEDLTPAQIQRLFEVLDSTHLTVAANMMKLALYTGLRRGELCKLQWGDIDFHRGFIRIREPKGGKAQTIPMSASAKDLLQSIPTADDEYVFPARNGGPRKDVSKEIKQIKDAAGLPSDFRPLHGLRHTFASMLANSGSVDLYTLQKLLTHKSPEMTKRYAHLRDEALQRAANKVDDILSNTLNQQENKPEKIVSISSKK